MKKDLVKFSYLRVRDDKGYEELIFSGISFGTREAHQRMKRSISGRLRAGSLNEDTKIHIMTRDASGYFKSCPEIFPEYYDRYMTCKEYLHL